MTTDDIESIKKAKELVATSDDDKVIRCEAKNEDCKMFTGSSINEILYEYTIEGREVILQDPFPMDYWYTDLTPDKEYPMDPNELVKPTIGCLFCNCEITLNSGCYMFVQKQSHYDRNVLLVACSDTCPVAFKQCTVSQCRKCERHYLYDLYDANICRLCR